MLNQRIVHLILKNHIMSFQALHLKFAHINLLIILIKWLQIAVKVLVNRHVIYNQHTVHIMHLISHIMNFHQKVLTNVHIWKLLIQIKQQLMDANI